MNLIVSQVLNPSDIILYILFFLISIGLLYIFFFVLRDKEGFNIIGYDKEGFNRKGFNRFGFNRKGYDFRGYDKFGFDVKGFNREGYDHMGYDVKGFNIHGFNLLGFDRQGYDSSGFDQTGFDKDGFDRKGFNKKGYDRNGINKDGFDKDGYTLLGYDANNIDREGYNIQGFNSEGYDRLGYDAEGFDKEGFDHLGFNKKGYDRDGFDVDGFNKVGFNSEGKDIHGDSWWLAGLYKKTLFNNKDFLKIYTEDSEFVSRENNYEIDPWDEFMDSDSFFDINTLDYSLNNPYNLLGLDIKSDNKSIIRRSSDIKKIISIEGDLNFCLSVFRRIIHRNNNFYEKETYTKLTDPIKKIAYQFFWFYHPNNDLVSKLLGQENQNTTFIISRLIKEYVTSKDIFALKSLILLANIYGIVFKSVKVILELMPYWKEVMSFDDIWISHREIYFSSLETESKKDNFTLFQNNFVHYLADYYYQIYDYFKDKTILTTFYKLHNFHSEKAQKELLYPLIQSLNIINESIDKLDKSSFNTSNVKSSLKIMKDHLISIEKIQSQIDEDQFSEHIEVKNIFEKLASTLRNTAIELLNEVDHSSSYFEQGVEWLKTALNYSESSTLINRIKQDLQDINIEKKKKVLLDQIESDLKNNYYDSARSKIEEIKSLDDSYENLKFANQLLILSYKKQANYNIKNALEEANSYSNSGMGRLAIPMVIRNLKKAISEIDVLILIAEKEDDYSEKSDLVAFKEKLSNNIRQLTYL